MTDRRPPSGAAHGDPLIHNFVDGRPGHCPECGRLLPLRAIILALWPTRLKCPNCGKGLRFERVWDVVGTLIAVVCLLSTLVVFRLTSPGLAVGERWVWVALLAIGLIFSEWWAARILRKRALQTVSRDGHPG